MATYEGPYKIVTEPLGDSGGDLKSFYFRRGANFYVFSYENAGIRRHTFIDSGDRLYRDRILTILSDNNVNPGNIERIIITHHHPDHCGLVDLLGRASGAKILVHSTFRGFVEGQVSKENRQFIGSLQPSRFQGLDMVYLDPAKERAFFPLAGINFPRLNESIDLGAAGRMDILACPESDSTHSPVQLILLYSPRVHPDALKTARAGFRLTDDIIFAGDLWLMEGPYSTRGFSRFYRNLRYAYYQIRNLSSGNPFRRREPREQDMETKAALKHGFSLIRVKPGHGEEFLGARIIPNGLLASRDILVLLGYDMNEDKSILKTEGMKPRIMDILEKAYASFAVELLFWMDQGFDENEISDLLVRIYREQKGGGSLVEEDRRERRERLMKTLTRLRDEATGGDSLRQVAVSTLQKLASLVLDR